MPVRSVAPDHLSEAAAHFSQKLPGRVERRRLVRHDPLQGRVFSLQLPKLTDVVDPHARVPGGCIRPVSQWPGRLEYI